MVRSFLIIMYGELTRHSISLIALAIAFPATYILGAAFPPQLVLLIFPRFSPPPPHKDSVRGKAHTNDVEDCMQKLQLVENTRKEIQAGAEWYETSELCVISVGGAKESLD